MTWNVSRFGPQTLAVAPNLEHWYTRFVYKPLPIWLLPSTACKLEEGKSESVLRELSHVSRAQLFYAPSHTSTGSSFKPIEVAQ